MKCNYCGNTKGEYFHFEGADYPVCSLKCGRALFGKDFCKERKKKKVIEMKALGKKWVRPKVRGGGTFCSACGSEFCKYGNADLHEELVFTRAALIELAEIVRTDFKCKCYADITVHHNLPCTYPEFVAKQALTSAGEVKP